MKTILTVTTEHDGLMTACFTNIKALDSYLTKEVGIGDSIIHYTDLGKSKEYKYNYSNLATVIKTNRLSNRFFVCTLFSDTVGDVYINELGVLSK